MTTLFKDIYCAEFYENFSAVLSKTLPKFNKARFLSLVFCDEFDNYELKQRMTHTVTVLKLFMADDFVHAATQLVQIVKNLEAANIREQSVEFMFIPEYIETYGIHDYKTSIAAFELITQFTSCEFAVRPFLIKYEARMLKQMLRWAKHKDNRVRRLASEGSRPRLPWAMALPAFKQDPTPLLPILSALIDDSCDVVRRSVANNLNDISKDHPEITIRFVKDYKGCSKEVDAVIKHACRTLLKQGNSQALKLFGFNSTNIVLTHFEIVTPKVKIGNDLRFKFSVANQNKKNKWVRLEYGLYFLKKNGGHSKKVFKISERELDANGIYDFERKQSFKIITTRTLYPGLHKVSLILNGQEMEIKEFTLQDK